MFFDDSGQVRPHPVKPKAKPHKYRTSAKVIPKKRSFKNAFFEAPLFKCYNSAIYSCNSGLNGLKNTHLLHTGFHHFIGSFNVVVKPD